MQTNGIAGEMAADLITLREILEKRISVLPQLPPNSEEYDEAVFTYQILREAVNQFSLATDFLQKKEQERQRQQQNATAWFSR